ncbi:hypothetical protein [Streptomyces sp. CBMA123]|uniref:hypothetical protein n=1 Tax=Streptomyces sp. CBMA123 TaxID=1896313 RepID=UPI001661AF67|nr:hypothetical protein [Streptomyces sp. CBMA123]MBD0689854.1 hypothetical protein [Streptomyces sp. CBMA123]
MDRRPRLCAVLTVALLLGGTPLAATAGVVLGRAVQQAVPAGLPGAVTGLLVHRVAGPPARGR